MKMNNGLEHLSFEERLRELGGIKYLWNLKGVKKTEPGSPWWCSVTVPFKHKKTYCS